MREETMEELIAKKKEYDERVLVFKQELFGDDGNLLTIKGPLEEGIFEFSIREWPEEFDKIYGYYPEEFSAWISPPELFNLLKIFYEGEAIQCMREIYDRKIESLLEKEKYEQKKIKQEAVKEKLRQKAEKKEEAKKKKNARNNP